METALTVDELGTNELFEAKLLLFWFEINLNPILKLLPGNLFLTILSHIEADLRPIQRVGNICLGFLNTICTQLLYI